MNAVSLQSPKTMPGWKRPPESTGPCETQSASNESADGMSRHFQRRRDRFRGLLVQGRALEDALRAVGDSLVREKTPQCNFKGRTPIFAIGVRVMRRVESLRPEILGIVQKLVGFALSLTENSHRLVAEDAGQVVVETPLFVWRVRVARQRAAQRRKSLLYDVVRLQGREAFAHERLHHGAVARDELAPAGVLRIPREIAQERRGCCWSVHWPFPCF